jgi:lipopolysaccharide transport system permease protein
MREAGAEVVYTPDSRLRRPGELFREMLADLRASREVAWRLMVRDIRVQYRRSVLGAAWTFIPAVATAATLTVATRARLLSVGETALPYPVYVLFGMTLWQTFLDALNGPVQALAAEMRLLAKFNVAPEAIVLSKLGEALFNTAVRFILVAAFMAWYGVAPAWSATLVPLGVVALLLLGAGLGLLLAPLSVLYQDVVKSLPIATAVWFLLTPIVYPLPRHGTASVLLALNPVTPLLATTRDIATGFVPSALPGFLAAGALAAALLLAGWVVYRVAMPIVVERARF